MTQEDCSPEVKKLRMDLEALTKRVDDQSSAITSIHDKMASCQSDTKETKEMMQTLLQKLGEGGTRAPTPRHSPQLPTTEAQPLFKETVLPADHDDLCELFGASNNSKKDELMDLLGEDGVPFTEWWEKMATFKSTAQWATKLKALGADEDMVNTDKKEMGELLFTHLAADRKFSKTPLQNLSPA